MIRFSSVLVLVCLPHITCFFLLSTSIRLQFHAISEFNVEQIDLRFIQKILKLCILICGLVIEHISRIFIQNSEILEKIQPLPCIGSLSYK